MLLVRLQVSFRRYCRPWRCCIFRVTGFGPLLFYRAECLPLILRGRDLAHRAGFAISPDVKHTVLALPVFACAPSVWYLRSRTSLSMHRTYAAGHLRGKAHGLLSVCTRIRLISAAKKILCVLLYKSPNGTHCASFTLSAILCETGPERGSTIRDK